MVWYFYSFTEYSTVIFRHNGGVHLVKHYLDTFLYAIMGGICIALGGTAYLCTENNIIGAFLFTIGLFTICTMGFNLYTGKVSYAFENKLTYIAELIFVWLGNLAGTAFAAWLLGLTRIGSDIAGKAVKICSTKLNDNLLSMFVLAIFCNLLIFIAVDEFNTNKHIAGKYLGLLFGVVAFIFCSFEHSIADMFYFSVAGLWSLKTLGYLIIITLGNAVGGLLVPAIRIAHKKLEA